MSDSSPIVKRLVIEYDVVNGDITYSNPDELTYIEVCGLLEFARLMITSQFIKDEN